MGGCRDDPWIGGRVRGWYPSGMHGLGRMTSGGVVAALLNHRLMAVNPLGSCGLDQFRGYHYVVPAVAAIEPVFLAVGSNP